VLLYISPNNIGHSFDDICRASEGKETEEEEEPRELGNGAKNAIDKATGLRMLRLGLKGGDGRKGREHRSGDNGHLSRRVGVKNRVLPPRPEKTGKEDLPPPPLLGCATDSKNEVLASKEPSPRRRGCSCGGGGGEGEEGVGR
jgi:hypothetical protein